MPPRDRYLRPEVVVEDESGCEPLQIEAISRVERPHHAWTVTPDTARGLSAVK
ncbi:MAG TPA: hypothetical protein VGR26_18225 [Acidimicrobiales bacterium]|nr:hypothetical protein [Acidimicrobiales bacterium]